MAHIVVLGAGIGGMPAAYELREVLEPEHEITVVNANDYFQFVPSNPWLAVGWRKREQITLPVSQYLNKHGIKFVVGWVAKIDAAGNRLILKDGQEVAYDYLVIATGPRLAFDEVPGSGPVDGYTQSVCTVDHAEKAHADFQKLVADPGHAIVGAVQFASCFGPAYEYAAILDTALRRARVRDRVPMTFVTSEPYVGHLGLGGVGDSRGLLEHEFRNRHIKHITNARVTRVEEITPGPEVLLPVPLHRERLLERGYNQADEIAIIWSREFGIPVERKALSRLRATPTQSGLSASQREENVRRAFAWRGGRDYRHVAIVDDIVTTGSTVGEITKTLHRAGVEYVEVWAIARVYRR